MKVTLINPPFHFEDTNLSRFPPLGLASIAAVLEENDEEVNIIDMATSENKPSETKGLPLSNADVVGISATHTHRFPEVMKISREIKRMDKDIPVVLGGNHATFMYERILQNHSSVDIIVMFEGEYTMLQLMKTLAGEKSLSEMEGIAYRNQSGKIVVTPRARKVRNLDALPLPARHLLPMELYQKGGGTGSIVSSRGCPYKCIFCSTAAFSGQEVRLNSAERILQEIKYLIEKCHTKEIQFTEDLFTFSRSRVNALCELITKENLDVAWGCLSRVDYVDEALLNRMHEAGCREIFYGVESGSQSILDRCGKHQTVEKARKAIELTKTANMDVCAAFILGLPGETHETIQKTRDFILETLPSETRLNLLVPYPGTSLYENPEDYGIRILSKDWKYYTHALPVTETDELSWKELLKAKSLMTREYLKAKGQPLDDVPSVL